MNISFKNSNFRNRIKMLHDHSGDRPAGAATENENAITDFRRARQDRSEHRGDRLQKCCLIVMDIVRKDNRRSSPVILEVALCFEWLFCLLMREKRSDGTILRQSAEVCLSKIDDSFANQFSILVDADFLDNTKIFVPQHHWISIWIKIAMEIRNISRTDRNGLRPEENAVIRDFRDRNLGQAKQRRRLQFKCFHHDPRRR